MKSDELDELVNQELETWGAMVLQRLAQEIQKKKLVLTEETLKSLQQDVLKASSSSIHQLQLAFSESGRINDMKRIDQKKRPPIEVMEQFVKDVGLSNFAYVPGYKKGQFPLTENQAIKRIAWGIAANKLNNNAHKPKKWFSKTFYGLLNPLIDNIVTKYQDATGQVIGGIAKF